MVMMGVSWFGWEVEWMRLSLSPFWNWKGLKRHSVLGWFVYDRLNCWEVAVSLSWDLMTRNPWAFVLIDLLREVE